MRCKAEERTLPRKFQQQPQLSLFVVVGVWGGGSEEVEGVFHELSLGIGEGCRGLQSALGSGGAWSANVCVCVTHRGVTTLTHTLPIGKMEHESACLTLQ